MWSGMRLRLRLCVCVCVYVCLYFYLFVCLDVKDNTSSSSYLDAVGDDLSSNVNNFNITFVLTVCAHGFVCTFIMSNTLHEIINDLNHVLVNHVLKDVLVKEGGV